MIEYIVKFKIDMHVGIEVVRSVCNSVAPRKTRRIDSAWIRRHVTTFAIVLLLLNIYCRDYLIIFVFHCVRICHLIMMLIIRFLQKKVIARLLMHMRVLVHIISFSHVRCLLRQTQGGGSRHLIMRCSSTTNNAMRGDRSTFLVKKRIRILSRLELCLLH